MDEQSLKDFLQEEAKFHGFDAFGICSPDSLLQSEGDFIEALANDYYGNMEFMYQTAYRRMHPANLWPSVKSILMLGMNYAPEEDPLSTIDQEDYGTISIYARNRDYHDVFKGKLKQMASRLVKRLGCEVKVFVDTAPVREKPLAAAAGLGWQGKHSNIVSREFGSWLFLGAIFLDLALPYDKPLRNFCGSCHACLTACPTNAFVRPYQLDARKCISYLTIELKEQIPLSFRQKIGNHIYGCDVCLAVCPWNKFAQLSRETKFHAREALKQPLLKDLLLLKETEFRLFFSGSPIKRIGRARFIRNCLVAAGNSQNREHIPIIIPLLEDESPLVRGMAIWSLNRLWSYKDWPERQKSLEQKEQEPEVLKEWSYVKA